MTTLRERVDAEFSWNSLKRFTGSPPDSDIHVTINDRLNTGELRGKQITVHGCKRNISQAAATYTNFTVHCHMKTAEYHTLFYVHLPVIVIKNIYFMFHAYHVFSLARNAVISVLTQAESNLLTSA